MASGNFIDKEKIINSPEFKSIVMDIHHQMMNKSREVVNDFYNHYVPMIYRRGWGFKNIVKPSISRIENGYLLSYSYSPEYFTASHRSDNDAFQSGFEMGFHGGPLAWGSPRKNDPQMQPSPWESLVEFFYEL